MTAAAERVAPALLAATVVVVALGSSSVDALASFGRSGRWPALFLLAAVAALLAVRRGSLVDAAREPLYAAAGGFVVLAALSVAWTVDPALTAQRAISLGTLVLAASGLGWAARGRPHLAGRLLLGLLAGAAAVAAAGLVVLALSSDDAVQAVTSDTPPRYRGLGENPNTVSMLVAIATPLALWAAMQAARGRVRAFGLASLVLFYGTIVFSGSRGAVLASFVGSLVVVLGTAPTMSLRLRYAGVAGALFVLAVGLGQLPQPSAPPSLVAVGPGTTGGETTPTATAPFPYPAPGTTGGEITPTATQPFPYPAPGATTPDWSEPFPYPVPGTATPAEVTPSEVPGGRLADETGRPTSVSGRTLLGSSGRVLAWRAAIGQGNNRPLLGYGFGTEDVVFVDRIYTFQGDRPENSFVGAYLQVGLVGVALLVVIVLTAVRGGARAIRSLAARLEALRLALAAAGVALAGAVSALVQSYVYSAGNIASLTVWTSLFIFAGAASWSEPDRGA